MSKDIENQILSNKVSKLETQVNGLSYKNSILVELITDLKQDIETLKNVVGRINEQMAIDAAKETEKPAD